MVQEFQLQSRIRTLEHGPMSEFNLTRIDRLRYRPTKSAEDFLNEIRSTLMPGDKASVARLAIGRSLGSPAGPDELIISEDTEFGAAIEGTHLFGDDTDIWATLVASSAQNPVATPVEFRRLIEAHWHRGATLLQRDYDDVRQSDIDFVVRLSGITPNAIGTGISDPSGRPHYSGNVLVRFGEKGTDVDTGEPVEWSLNGPGISPHIAVLGKTRSGKSRTGLNVAKQIIATANIPVLVIDPKGEFVKDGQLIEKSEWGGNTLSAFFPGISPIEVPRTPIPLDFLALRPNASQHERATIAIAFRDSFEKCIRAKGDVALDRLRQVVLELLNRKRGQISLRDIYGAYLEASEEAGTTAGSIGAKLAEIDSLRLFSAEQTPDQFFSKRWVISLGSASQEAKRLAMFLTLDALSSYLLTLEDASIEGDFRTVRHLLVIDEAKEILAYKHEALSTLIRRSASKGGITMLLSQGAEDFDQEEDDFLEQMGAVGVFALSSSSVRKLVGTFGGQIKPQSFSDQRLPKGVALVKLPAKKTRLVQAW
jgi:hypothetical protein